MIFFLFFVIRQHIYIAFTRQLDLNTAYVLKRKGQGREWKPSSQTGLWGYTRSDGLKRGHLRCRIHNLPSWSRQEVNYNRTAQTKTKHSYKRPKIVDYGALGFFLAYKYDRFCTSGNTVLNSSNNDKILGRQQYYRVGTGTFAIY